LLVRSREPAPETCRCHLIRRGRNRRAVVGRLHPAGGPTKDGVPRRLRFSTHEPSDPDAGSFYQDLARVPVVRTRVSRWGSLVFLRWQRGESTTRPNFHTSQHQVEGHCNKIADERRDPKPPDQHAGPPRTSTATGCTGLQDARAPAAQTWFIYHRDPDGNYDRAVHPDRPHPRTQAKGLLGAPTRGTRFHDVPETWEVDLPRWDRGARSNKASLDHLKPDTGWRSD